VDEEKTYFQVYVVARQLAAPALQNYCLDRIQAMENINHRQFIFFAYQIDREGFGDYPLVDYMVEKVAWDALAGLFDADVLDWFLDSNLKSASFTDRLAAKLEFGMASKAQGRFEDPAKRLDRPWHEHGKVEGACDSEAVKTDGNSEKELQAANYRLSNAVNRLPFFTS
jgi:hypothetical protein